MPFATKRHQGKSVNSDFGATITHLTRLFKLRMPRKTDVLNGIAYDAKGDRLFITGKRWPKLFEIKLVKRSAP